MYCSHSSGLESQRNGGGVIPSSLLYLAGTNSGIGDSTRCTVSCGKEHSPAGCHKGRVFAWGSDGQLGVGRIFDSVPTPQIVEHLSGVPLVQISAGEAHSMALSMSGNIYSWGRNDCGQLGLDIHYICTHTHENTTIRITGLPLQSRWQYF
uniref:Uncharacterized protein n=1 Tax=Phocoena sinus TaxID=42100 RepID=A0A8C9B4T2_PHOSS